MMQQLSGINALIYYSTAVFGAAGLSSPVVGTVLLAVVNLLGEFHPRRLRHVDVHHCLQLRLTLAVTSAAALSGQTHAPVFPWAGSILASSCSDRIGRRPLMITSHIGMAVSLLVTAAAACAPGKPTLHAAPCECLALRTINKISCMTIHQNPCVLMQATGAPSCLCQPCSSSPPSSLVDLVRCHL